MRVGIVGGGAIGLLMAAYMSDAHAVTVYTRRREQAEQLAARGVTLITDDGARTSRIEAKPLAERSEQEDVLMIAVKQYDLAHVLCAHEPHLQSPALLFLQNGMSHVLHLSQLAHEHIALAVVEHGALKIDETTVHHTGVGRTKWSVWKGDKAAFIHALTHERFPFQYVDDWEALLIEKLMVNVAINPLTALLGVRNGLLVESEPYRRAMRRLFDEVATVLQIEERERMWEHVCTVCRQTANNRSSMLRDVEEGKKTEIDAIVAYVLERAAKRKMRAPLSEFIYDLVKGKELER